MERMAMNEIPQDMNIDIDQIPAEYAMQYGYKGIHDEISQLNANPMVNNPYLIQNGRMEGMHNRYVDKRYHGYNLYDNSIPINNTMSNCYPPSYQMLAQYEQGANGNVIYYNGADYLDYSKEANNPHFNGKVIHRQKKNFLCC